MRDIEHQIAVAFMMWWAYSCKTLGRNPLGMNNGYDERLLMAIPNGGHRHPNVARKLKAEGVRSGVSDYFLAVARNGKMGLFLELKAGGPGITKGRLSPEQIEFGELVRQNGYGFQVAYGTDQAIKAIEDYLK